MTAQRGAPTTFQTLSGATTQASFDDLGAPLADVTFCVIDLETTGGDPHRCAITEIGAVKLRGGTQVGTFQTMINPGSAIPPSITLLTGITEAMTFKAPRIESVLASLLEFIGDAVIVGHNVRFDLGFIEQALSRDGRVPLANQVIDTVTLARRLVRSEVANCKLSTLARRFRLPHQPSHRALDDALATGDLLHVLLDRAGSLGVRGLDDLRSLPTMANHPQAAKLRLTQNLPREPGVYLFRDATGRVLYVGKATNLRSRVRSYFSTDDRRKTGSLLAQTQRIDHKRCATEFEAAVLEVRLIHHCEPPFNVEANRWRSSVYVKLTTERLPRLCIVRDTAADDAQYLGPLPSRRGAQRVIDAIHSVVPLRRRNAGGVIDHAVYAVLADAARAAMTTSPRLVIDPLAASMQALAAEERFEEAAAVRDRVNSFADAVERQRGFERLRRAALLEVLDQRSGHRFELRRGRLTRHWAPERSGVAAALEGVDPGRLIEATPPDPGPTSHGPLPRELADELLVTLRWLDGNATTLRANRVVGSYWEPLPRLDLVI